MITSSRQALNEVYTMLKDAWEADILTSAIDIVWGNVAHVNQGKPDLQGNPIPYLRAQFVEETGKKVAMVGDGRSKHEHRGTLIAVLRTPEGKGEGESSAMISVVTSAFSGTRSPNGVWFRNPQQTSMPPDGTWARISMTTTFVYDLIR